MGLGMGSQSAEKAWDAMTEAWQPTRGTKALYKGLALRMPTCAKFENAFTKYCRDSVDVTVTLATLPPPHFQ